MENEILSILKDMQGQMNSMASKMDIIESKVDEHTLILRALEHSAEVNIREHDKMSHDIAIIMGDLQGLKKDLAQVELVTANN
ncbi:MAG: hypothetical protein K0S71_1277 [Clostridia bacterium]|jgi:hypothetical protein|nr:hypothetical protein [Clostridia bacterium]